MAQLEAVQQGAQEAAPFRRLRQPRSQSGASKVRPGNLQLEEVLSFTTAVHFVLIALRASNPRSDDCCHRCQRSGRVCGSHGKQRIYRFF